MGSKGTALLDDATNMLGPLSPEIRGRVAAFLGEPTEARWDDIHGILIRPFRTIWQAVIAEDPTFPKTGPITGRDRRGRETVVAGWSRVPDALVVARAIRNTLRGLDTGGR